MAGRKKAGPGKSVSHCVFCCALSLLLFNYSLTISLAQASQAQKQNHSQSKAPSEDNSQPFDLTYTEYGRDLDKYVEGESGLVHYRQWQKDAAGLTAFVNSLAGLDPVVYNKWSREEQLAFWLNVYNALTIKSVLDHYPIKAKVDYFPPSSIRQFNDGWEVLQFEVMGKPITLYEIEHERLRRHFRDPRVHFAVASGSMDSARISKKPYVAPGLDQRLDDRARRFFAQPDTFAFDPQLGSVRVSKIFSWFMLDFAAKAGYGKMVFPPPRDEEIIISYLRQYLPDDRREALDRLKESGKLKFDYLNYDWSLNDADQNP